MAPLKQTSQAVLLACLLLFAAVQPSLGKGGLGSGGSSPSYSSSSSYSYGYGNRPSGYYYNRPSGYYYSSGTSSGSSGSNGFWGLVFPVGLVAFVCCCCAFKSRRRTASPAFVRMVDSNTGFLMGGPGESLGIALPVVAASNRAFALPAGCSNPTRWRGEYTEAGRLKYTMYEFTFSQSKAGALDGPFTGSGKDDDGDFWVEGIYSLKTGRFVWTEVYPSGMKTAVQQQGIAAGSSNVIGAMQGVYAATTGVTGKLAMTAMDAEMGPALAVAQLPPATGHQQPPPSGAYHYPPVAAAAAAVDLPAYSSAPQPPPGYPPVAAVTQQNYHSEPGPLADGYPAPANGYPPASGANAAPNPYAPQPSAPAYPPPEAAPAVSVGASLWGGPAGGAAHGDGEAPPAPKI